MGSLIFVIIQNIIIATAIKEFNCTSSSSCIGSDLDCNVGGESDCIVNCGDNSCNGTILANNITSLTVNCIGTDSCNDMVINGETISNVVINCTGASSCGAHGSAFTVTLEASVVTMECSGSGNTCNAYNAELNIQVVNGDLSMKCSGSGNPCRAYNSFADLNIQVVNGDLSMECSGSGGPCNAIHADLNIQVDNGDLSMECSGSGGSPCYAFNADLNIHVVNGDLSMECSGSGPCYAASYPGYNANLNINGRYANELLIIGYSSTELTPNTIIACPENALDANRCYINITDTGSLNDTQICTSFGLDSFVLDCNGNSCFDVGSGPIVKCNYPNFLNQCQIENATSSWNEWQCINQMVIGCPTRAPSQPSLAPSQISLAPSQSSLAPSQTSLSPSQTSLAPSQTSLAPSQISLAPSQISLAPSQTSLAPSEPSLAPAQTSLSPSEPPTSDSESGDSADNENSSSHSAEAANALFGNKEDKAYTSLGDNNNVLLLRISDEIIWKIFSVVIVCCLLVSINVFILRKRMGVEQGNRFENGNDGNEV